MTGDMEQFQLGCLDVSESLMSFSTADIWFNINLSHMYHTIKKRTVLSILRMISSYNRSDSAIPDQAPHNLKNM